MHTRHQSLLLQSNLVKLSQYCFPYAMDSSDIMYTRAFGPSTGLLAVISSRLFFQLALIYLPTTCMPPISTIALSKGTGPSRG